MDVVELLGRSARMRELKDAYRDAWDAYMAEVRRAGYPDRLLPCLDACRAALDAEDRRCRGWSVEVEGASR